MKCMIVFSEREFCWSLLFLQRWLACYTLLVFSDLLAAITFVVVLVGLSSTRYTKSSCIVVSVSTGNFCSTLLPTHSIFLSFPSLFILLDFCRMLYFRVNLVNVSVCHYSVNINKANHHMENLPFSD
ncbi:hypothetical protein RvY_02490 [Ramazzottius varieornatus]|uniref:Uncharacterized protein n=1 Tax=Ramazzottius varieornatus TaxID=947166 RepID=A0A1D1UV08_RAMVA|nr:hypothetical protein RvY_02490 [Ramazzottius varieornatus]